MSDTTGDARQDQESVPLGAVIDLLREILVPLNNDRRRRDLPTIGIQSRSGQLPSVYTARTPPADPIARAREAMAFTRSVIDARGGTASADLARELERDVDIARLVIAGSSARHNLEHVIEWARVGLQATTSPPATTGGYIGSVALRNAVRGTLPALREVLDTLPQTCATHPGHQAGGCRGCCDVASRTTLAEQIRNLDIASA
jgi:hypothetical protein